jgi:hypothetical protein
MAKVCRRAIVSDSARVDRDCVATLAKLYRAAQRGEFQAVAIATVTESGHGNGGCFGTAWSEAEKRSELAGSIGYLNHRFMQEAIYEA